MLKSIVAVVIASSRHAYYFLSHFAASAALWTFLSASQDCMAQVVAPEVAAPSVPQASHSATGHAGTIRQQAWLKATINQRVRLAEALGEKGARAFAKMKGWEPIFDGIRKGIMQGPDQVYRGIEGAIHVLEAKGGTSQLGRAYGHAQGSSEWAVEAAKRVSRSVKALMAEKIAADAVLKAAAQRKLQVHVIRTSHVLGEPTAAVLKQTVQTSEAAAKLARTALDDVAKASAQTVDDAARLTDNAARVAAKGSSAVGATLKTVAKAGVVVAVVVDGCLMVRDGIATERKFAAGEISVQQREVSHAKNAAGMAGGLGGAAGGAWIAGSTAAPIAAMTGPAAPFVEGAAVAAGGITGYIVGEAAVGAAAEWTVSTVHSTGSTIGGAATSAWSATTGAARSTGKAARNAWSWATGW